MPFPAGDTTTVTYTGNRSDGESINIYGDIHGGLHLHGKVWEPCRSADAPCPCDERKIILREDAVRIKLDKVRLFNNCYGRLPDDVSIMLCSHLAESRRVCGMDNPGLSKKPVRMGVVRELCKTCETNLASKTRASTPAKSDLNPATPSPVASSLRQGTVRQLSIAVSVWRELVFWIVVLKTHLVHHVLARLQVMWTWLFVEPSLSMPYTGNVVSTAPAVQQFQDPRELPSYD